MCRARELPCRPLLYVPQFEAVVDPLGAGRVREAVSMVQSGTKTIWPESIPPAILFESGKKGNYI